MARTAMHILVDAMKEYKEKGPDASREPVHKVITPVLVRRDTDVSYQNSL
jgi:hypothetical protein